MFFEFEKKHFKTFELIQGNVRSQIAIGRIGAQKIAEQEIEYFGEDSNLNFVYEIKKQNWEKRNSEKQLANRQGKTGYCRGDSSRLPGC